MVTATLFLCHFLLYKTIYIIIKDMYLYVLVNTKYDFFKIGIAKDVTIRLHQINDSFNKVSESNGVNFKCIYSIKDTKSKITFLETTLHRYFKQYRCFQTLKFDGYTESFDIAALKHTTLSGLVKMINDLLKIKSSTF